MLHYPNKHFIRRQAEDSYHDGFKSRRRSSPLVVDLVHVWSPDVQVETVLADRVLGVPHIRADEVSERVVDWLHARVANVVRFVRICSTHAHTYWS